jgi:hypothetical protein
VISPRLAAWIFCLLSALVIAFQLALALGVPWGEYAMGGRFPGAYPPPMRVAALVQTIPLGLMALLVLARAGLVLPAWRRAARAGIWVVVGFAAVATVLNLITPSPLERLIWAPVAILLLLTSLRVALAPRASATP